MRFYYLVAIIISFSQFSLAQNKVQIINADLAEFIEEGDTKIQILSGNVKLEQNGIYLYSDKANFYKEKNSVDAFGNVRIQQDTINIYSDKLSYNGNERKAKLSGNVRLTDNRMTLTTSQLDYDLNTRVGNYSTSGILKSDSSVLTSKIGYYYAVTHDIFFRKDVKLVNPKYILTADTLRFNTENNTAYFHGPTDIKSDSNSIYCEKGYYNTKSDLTEFSNHAILINYPQVIKADTIFYDRNKGIGIARSNVDWNDTAKHIIIRGNFAEYNENNASIIATRYPLFIDASDRKDSMFLSADTLYSKEIDSTETRMFRAYHNVKILRENMQAVCDSISYSDTDSTFRFYGNPILWVDNNQLTADTISLVRGKKSIQSFAMNVNALVVNLSDSLQYNQIQGKKMKGYFLDGKLSKLTINGNGESIYYAKDDDEISIGVNKAVCSNMTIVMKDSKVQRIKFYEKPEATLYPLNDIPAEELKLKSFRWEESKKPNRGLFNR